MPSSDTRPLPTARSRSVRGWNVLSAFLLLLLSVWTLSADLAHEGHFLLQSSLSTLFLGLYVTAWMFAAVIFAGFPKRFVLAAVILTTARLSFGWPLLVVSDLKSSCLVLDGLLVLIALAHLLVSFGSGTLATRPWIRWQHSVAMGAASLLASILSLPAGLFGLANVVEDTSAGYVRLTPGGIDLTERIFERNGRRVHLIGMAHIADGGFYDTLNRSLAQPVEGRRLVLLEGVSDNDGILPRSFTSGETYRVMAEKLGLAEQALGFAVQPDGETGHRGAAAWAERGVDFRTADIDVRELDPEHRERLVSLLGAMENLDLGSFFTMPDGMTASDLEELIVEGLLKRRNERLMEVFSRTEEAYAEIFIPWGAAHLPDLERRLLAVGYEAVAENHRRGIDFWKRFR